MRGRRVGLWAGRGDERHAVATGRWKGAPPTGQQSSQTPQETGMHVPPHPCVETDTHQEQPEKQTRSTRQKARKSAEKRLLKSEFI